MRWTTQAGLAALLFTLAVMPAAADTLEYDARDAHAAADKNKDGYVDREEFRIRMVEIFYHSDGDKNGRLTIVELQPLGEEMVHAPADLDGDGGLNMTEYINHRSKGFDEADKNVDGLLSVEEVVQIYEGS